MGNSLSYEQKTEMQFDKLVKVSLGNEIKKYFNERKRRLENEILFSELGEGQAENLIDNVATNAINQIESYFQVLHYTVTVHDELLYDALSKIDERARNIVLMFDWLNMSDKEISDETGAARRTVNDIRNKAYGKLKIILEAQGYDANSFFPKRES